MEIVIRACVLFVFLWIVTRAVGRSTLGELSTFEMVLFVTMGDLVQQGVTQQDYSITGAALAVSTFAVLTVALSWTQWRWPRSRTVVTGRPMLVVRHGVVLEEAMASQRLALADFLVSAREQGIRRVSDIEFAILEADGRLSMFPYAGDPTAGAPEKPLGGS